MSNSLGFVLDNSNIQTLNIQQNNLSIYLNKANFSNSKGFNGKIYEFIVYDENEEIIFDAVPDKSGTFKEKISDTLLTTSGVVEFGYDNWTGYVEPTYTKLEYIEDTANTYIDTDIIIGNSKFKIELDYEPTKVGYDYNGIWGVSSGSTKWEAWIARDGEYSRYNGTKPSQLNINANKRIKFTDEFNGNEFNTYIDENLERHYNISASNMNSSLVILRCSGSNANAKLYAAKLYIDEELALDLIPATSSYGQIGMYDKLNKKFYGSMTNNDFIAGPEIGPIKEE